jgi:tetratricopeptide (TPR) repeat protein
MLRNCFLVLTGILTLGSARAQQAPPTKEGEPPVPVVKDEVKPMLQEVQSLTARHRYFEALQELDKAEALNPGSPVFPNMRGSIYTTMRDFDKARGYFEESIKLLPEAFEPKFNLAELFYVQHKYAEAEAAFAALLAAYPRLREEVRHLTQFKVMVCRLKQNHLPEAQQVAAKNFTFMDDTPAYYFANAALSFQKGNTDEANSWLGKARRIFKPEMNAAYFDSLMEAHWLNSLSVPERSVEEDKGLEKP